MSFATSSSNSYLSSSYLLSSWLDDDEAKRERAGAPWSWSVIAPSDEREEPLFRDELQRVSERGLRTIAWISIGVSAFFLLLGYTLTPQLLPAPEATWFTFGLGVVVLPLARVDAVRRWARGVGILVGYLVALSLTWGFLTTPNPAESAPYVVGFLVFVPMVGVAILPVTPLAVAGLGLAIALTYLASVRALGLDAILGTQVYFAFAITLQVAATCLLLAAVVYRQRAAAFHARRQAQQAFEGLRDAQARLLVSENAASSARFAAALSHELNTPLGALQSAVGTIVAALDKIDRQPSEAPRLGTVLRESARTVRGSSERLRETIDHMKELTNLDRSELQRIDINGLIESTVSLLGADEAAPARIDLELDATSPVACRPQQMSAVFSNVIRNAATALGDDGVISVSSRDEPDSVVVEVIDNGTGISPERLEQLFEPQFRVERGRVATTNWGLFVCRSIVSRHGGHIEIESREREGTTVRIQMPID